jgi:hypothetical protein
MFCELRRSDRPLGFTFGPISLKKLSIDVSVLPRFPSTQTIDRQFFF